MFLENEPSRTLTLIEFLLVMLIGLAPVASSIWMKLMLRRIAEGEKDSLERANYQSPDAASSADVSSDATVSQLFQVGEPRIVRKLPATYHLGSLC